MASSSSSAAHLAVDEQPARALRLELEGEKEKEGVRSTHNEEQGTRAEGDNVDYCASGTHSALPEPKPTEKLDERIFEPFLPKNFSARSDVWSTTAFMKIRVKDSRVVCKDFAVCSLCRTIFKCKKGNTSTLTRHHKACSEKRKDTPSVLHYIKDPTPLAGDQRVGQALPFTVTESVAFRKLIQLATDLGARNGRPFDADRSLPSAKAVLTAVKERYSKVKEELPLLQVKSRLKHQNRPLQMQFDAWKTYHKGEEVLATTVVLEKDENEGAEPDLIALRKLESGQGEDIADTLQTVLDDYGVRKDEVLFLSDSCSANIKGLTTLGAASIPCYGHLLQLAVKAGTYPATTVSNPATGDTQKSLLRRQAEAGGSLIGKQVPLPKQMKKPFQACQLPSTI
ncbi:hypothetical protein FOZ62_018712 [Perkinsus olseni]|uniref:BED-type domain-containing protein n=1 Tax=Perkinsus olseni TaxID=32597 RepID=A0A7J6QWC2_PEROL|nr:hypothetical protein FOZ62_018712 [Perkinsus olseni]